MNYFFLNYNKDPLAFFQNTSVFSYPSYSFIIFIILVKIVLLLVAVAYFTIAERKCMAATQRRKGPNVVGSYGLLQPLADGLKLLLKDLLIPTSSSKSIFLLAPVAILTLSFISWSLIPFFLESIEVMYCMENSEIPTGESCEKTPQEKVKSKKLTDWCKDKWNSSSQNEKNWIIGWIGFLNFAGGIYVIAQYYDISWDDVAKFLTVLGIIPSKKNGPREPRSPVLQDNDGKVVDKTQYPIFPPRTDVPTSLEEQLLFYLISVTFLLTFYYTYLQQPFLFIPLNILYLIGVVILHYKKTKNYINFFLIKLNFIWTNKEYILRSWTWLEKIRFVSTIKDIFVFHFLCDNKYYKPIFFGLHFIYFLEIYENPFCVPDMTNYNLWFTYFMCIVYWTSTFALLFLFNTKISAKFREKFLCVVTKNLAYAILGNPGGRVIKAFSDAGAAVITAVSSAVGLGSYMYFDTKKQNNALIAQNERFRIKKQAETEELRIQKQAETEELRIWKQARNEGYRIHLEQKQDPRTFVEEPFEEFTKRKPRGFKCVIEETYSIFDFFPCLSSLQVPDLRYFTYLFIIFRTVIFDRFNWLIVFGYANMFKRSLVCSVKTGIKKISFIVSSKRDLLFDIILAISYVSFSVMLIWSKPMEVVYSLSEFSTAIKAVPVLSNSVLLQRSYPFVSFVPYTLMNILALSSLSVYGIIISGWASNSKYAFLGSLRSAAQMISYEVSIGLVLLPVVLLSFNLNLSLIVLTQFQKGLFAVPLLPCAIIFFVSMLAETNRTPFDLPEAEAELVAGYNIEYAAIVFAMFFLGEYSNMLFMSTLNTLLFFGGWNSALSFLQSEIVPVLLLSIKISVFCFLFILVRATLPRYKYNQLMQIGWKVFLPISLSYLMLISSLVIIKN